MSFPQNWLTQMREAAKESDKRTSEALFQLSVERAHLQKLVSALYPGLNDTWKALPENASIVDEAKEIHAREIRTMLSSDVDQPTDLSR